MLNKKETLEEIEGVYHFVSKLYDNIGQIEIYNANFKKTKYVPTLKEDVLSFGAAFNYSANSGFLQLLTILCAIVGGFISAVLFSFGIISGIISFLLGLAAGALPIMILDTSLEAAKSMSYNNKVIDHNELHKSKYGPVVEKLKSEIPNLLDGISGTKIPEIYLKPGILDQFRKYLETYRADNLKECINIYEEEARHNQQLQELINLEMNMSNRLKSIDNSVASTNAYMRQVAASIEYQNSRS